MRGLQNVMRAQAMLAQQGKQHSRLGIVTAYDPNTYSVKVQFPPDASETGWIPMGALSVGSAWGIYAPPVLGDQIEVRFQDGDRDAGIAGMRLFDNQSPPVSVPSGEIWVLHKSGAFFKLTTDGKARFDDSKGGSVTLNADGTVTSTGAWTHQGNMTVTQNLTVTQNATVNGSTAVKAITSNAHDISSTHTHTAVTSGSAVSGPPV
jgi:phage baseplate assembly protein V